MTEQTEIADLIASIKTDLTTIVRGEIALAADDLKPEAGKAGVIAGMFSGAGVFALGAVAVLFNAFGFAWSIGFQRWFNLDPLTALFWGFAAMGFLMLVIAGVLAAVGAKWPKPEVPTRTARAAAQHVEVVKESISEAAADAANLPLGGRSK